MAWPRLLGAIQGNHLACSGAVVADVLARGQERRPPDDQSQLARLSQRAAAGTVSLVTLTLGGNDAGFANLVQSCRVGPGDCIDDFEGTELPRLESLGNRLETAYAAVQGAAAPARVLVVGYPDIFPTSEARWTACGWMTDTEKERIETFARLLEGTIRDAAEAAGVEFVPVRDVLDDHELCTPDSWVVPVTSTSTGLLDQVQAHPNRSGQEAIAAAVRAYLDANPTPPTPGSDLPATTLGSTDVSFAFSSSTGYTYDVGLQVRSPVVPTGYGDPGYLRFENEPGWVTLGITNTTPNREAQGGAFWVKAWYELPPALTRDLTSGDVPFGPYMPGQNPPTTLYVQAVLGVDNPSGPLPVGGSVTLPEDAGRIVASTYASESLKAEWEALFAGGAAYFTIEAQTAGFGNERGSFACSSSAGDIEGLWGLVAVVRADGTLIADGENCAIARSLARRRGRY